MTQLVLDKERSSGAVAKIKGTLMVSSSDNPYDQSFEAEKDTGIRRIKDTHVESLNFPVLLFVGNEMRNKYCRTLTAEIKFFCEHNIDMHRKETSCLYSSSSTGHLSLGAVRLNLLLEAIIIILFLFISIILLRRVHRIIMENVGW